MRILITGCSSGLGRAAALALAGRGHQVVATVRRAEDALALRDAGLAVELLDVTDAAAVRRAVATVEAAGPLDALVNNAGVPCFGAMEELAEPLLRHAMEVNFFGPFRLCQAVVPHLRRRGRGQIVNVSSSIGRAALALYGGYSASKFALEAMSEALHLELAHFGVVVRLLEPGLIATPFAAAKGLQREAVAHGTAYGALLMGPEPPDLGDLVSSSRDVADALATMLETPTGPFRVTVGEDSRRWIEARKRLNDTEFLHAVTERGYGFDPGSG